MTNKNEPEYLVSVVIPYYEHKQYIESCINSIVRQTYENIEVRIQVQKSGTKEGCSSIPTEAFKAEAKKFTTERP